MIRLFPGVALLALLVAGCENNLGPVSRLNAPPHGIPDETKDLQGTFVYMVDNALLEDMTVSDVHFYPHRPLLNTLGEKRLARLASLIEAYGGQIRHSTDEPDTQLVEARLQVIRDFLVASGAPFEADMVVLDLPGGHGMDAKESLLVQQEVGRYQKGENAKRQENGGGFNVGKD